MLNERWVPYENAKAEDLGNGVVRRVLAYSRDLMCVENTFEKGRVVSSCYRDFAYGFFLTF